MAITEANMKEYYAHVYPVEDVVDWVSYRNSMTAQEAQSYMTRREFCFTLIGDIFTRHRTYTSVENLRNELVAKFPEKIDIGAVYNVSCDLKKATNIVPLERELVFDIDMSDYDAVRSCCKGKKVCEYCWPWMSSAAHILRKICIEDFGFKYFLPVFSGRRGIHLWVCDRKARKMTDEERSACVGYMTVVEGEHKTSLTFDLLRKEPAIHPTFEEVHNTQLVPTFKKIFLDDPTSPNHIATNPEASKIVYGALSAIGLQHFSPDVKTAIRELEPAEGECLKWEQVAKKIPGGVLAAVRFDLLYPRLDEHVSTRRDHLLKLPFCVHPGTSKLCTPLMWETLDDFHPINDPPKLDELLMTRSIDAKWKRPLINMSQDMEEDKDEMTADRQVEIKQESVTVKTEVKVEN